jgi:phenylacetate-CoA ligase
MLKTVVKHSPTRFLNRFESHILSDFKRAKKFLTTVDPDLLEKISEKKAVNMFQEIAKNTPAYMNFLMKNKVNPRNIKTIENFNRLVPQTTKSNYIKKYSLEMRCVNGQLPKEGSIDESGGTTGPPTNWIHDFREETLLFKAINFEYDYIFDGITKNHLVISAWSTGPWATGIKFCELMEKVTLVKSASTDPNTVVRTLKLFGKDKNYIIAGYPPFLKTMLDNWSKKIKWKDYKIDLATGGEGVTLEWVNYMKKNLKPGAKILSSYGSSDIDIGVGMETPLCAFIRERAAKNKRLRLELFGKDEIPMVFQYNPGVHYITEFINPDGVVEFEVTLLDKAAAMPKIKYNIQDEGRRYSHNDLINILKKHCPHNLDHFKKTSLPFLHLPFLCIFGRSDGTLSFDGANVLPNQIESGIMNHPELSKKTKRFKLEKKYNKKHDVEFHLHFELEKDVKPSKKLELTYGKHMLKHLMDSNQDFKESYTKNKTLKPKINMYKHGHPLFKIDELKVKNIYIINN